MKDYCKDFSSFEGKVWLNAASEGALPLVASKALGEAIGWKERPYELDIPKFIAIQKGLKESIGQLIGVNARDVILANSASYGIHLIANGYPFEKGDEILLMENDFPTDILPWLALEEKGVCVIQVKPKDKVLSPEELEQNITEKTKLFCISHVHTFTGITCDIDGFSRICKKSGINFVLNCAQSVGTRILDAEELGADVIVAPGYKWLCGPYGTGFCWIKPELREELRLNQSYWASSLSEEELQTEGPLKHKLITSARKYDVFGTANFFNFVPFKAAIDYFLEVGLEKVQQYHDHLVDYLIKNLDKDKYNLISPEEGRGRSSSVFISHKTKDNQKICDVLLKQDIYTAYWRGNIRIAAHIYNKKEDIDRLLETLDRS